MKSVKGVRRVAVKSKSKSASVKKSDKPYGVKKVRGGVVFTAYYPSASSVQIGGDFNGWQPHLSQMTKISDDGIWQLKIPLTAGSYRYRFVVDGQWQHDPNNTTTEPNPYGELNSVLQVNK